MDKVEVYDLTVRHVYFSEHEKDARRGDYKVYLRSEAAAWGWLVRRMRALQKKSRKGLNYAKNIAYASEQYEHLKALEAAPPPGTEDLRKEAERLQKAFRFVSGLNAPKTGTAHPRRFITADKRDLETETVRERAGLYGQKYVSALSEMLLSKIGYIRKQIYLNTKQ